jgi:DNA polymerase kappa
MGTTRVADMSSKERKSMSTEATFRDTSSKDELFQTIDSLCSEISDDLISEGLKGSQVTVKIKTYKFDVRTKATNLFQPSNDVAVLRQAARFQF